MSFKRISILVIMNISVFKVEAYIPSSEMILSRMERTQGRGWYQITQKVTFLENFKLKEAITFNETWWVGPKRALVRVTSPQYSDLKVQFIYNNFSKMWADSNKKKYSRSGNYIETYFLQKEQQPSWMEKVEDLRLGRALGVVNYVFQLKPYSVWVEQDEFVIRQIQHHGRFILKLFDYQSFARGLLFPQRRELTSSDYKVTFDVLEVRPLGEKKERTLIPNQWGESLQSIELVKTFYQKFR